MNQEAMAKLRAKFRGMIEGTFQLHDVERENVAAILEELARDVRRGELG